MINDTKQIFKDFKASNVKMKSSKQKLDSIIYKIKYNT